MFKDLAEKKVWLTYGEGKAPRDLDGNIIDGSNGSYWTRAEAEAAVADNESLRGVGISFKNSGFRGIDLDSCINEEGVVASWAREVIEQVGGLVDISMSGKGLKVVVRDDTDLGQAYIKSTIWDGEEILGMSRDKNPEIMVTQKGFYALTGNVFEGNTDLEPKGRISEVLERSGKNLSHVGRKIADAGGSEDKIVRETAVATAINTCQPIPGEQDGSNRLMKVIKTLYSWNVSDRGIHIGVREYGSVHPFPQEISSTKIDREIERVKSRDANIRGGSVMSESERQGDHWTDKLVLIENLQGPEKVDWILEGLIGRSIYTMINGQPKAGKSTWLNSLYRRANGGTFCNRDIKPFKVLVISEEPAIVWMQRRREMPEGRIFIAPGTPATVGVAGWIKFLEEVEEIIVRNKIDMVVLDSVAALSPVEENSAKEVAVVVDRIRVMTERANVATVAVHHTAKNTTNGVARGSGVWASSTDVNIGFVRAGTSEGCTTRKMHCQGRFAEVPAVLELDYDLETGDYANVGESDGISELVKDKMNKIRDWIAKQEHNRCTRQELTKSDAVDSSNPNTVEKLVKDYGQLVGIKMVKQGNGKPTYFQV